MKESNHTIDELKQEYEQIPVSPHAKEQYFSWNCTGQWQQPLSSHIPQNQANGKRNHILFIFYGTPVQLLWQPWPRW